MDSNVPIKFIQVQNVLASQFETLLRSSLKLKRCGVETFFSAEESEMQEGSAEVSDCSSFNFSAL